MLFVVTVPFVAFTVGPFPSVTSMLAVFPWLLPSVSLATTRSPRFRFVTASPFAIVW